MQLNVEIQKQMITASTIINILTVSNIAGVVLGGAPRDWTLGVPAKDIDVYVKKIPIGLFPDLVPMNKLSAIGYGNPAIREIYETVIDGIPIQFMEVEALNIWDKFPYSISQACYNGTMVTTSEAFKFTLQHKTLVKTGKDYSRGGAYSKKIKRKFKDYATITAEEYLTLTAKLS